jgi:hypothetical protein
VLEPLLQGIDSSEAHARLLIIRCQKEVADEHHHLHFKGHTMKRAEEGQLEMDLAGFFALLLDADINGVHDVSKVSSVSTPLLSNISMLIADNERVATLG